MNMKYGDDDDETDDQSSVAIERQYATSAIKLLHQLIVDSYGICPVFFTGHLRDAFDSAFGRSLVKKRRPLLIYIHHNDRMLDPFCSEIMIEFLTENYIVWPWDISSTSNRQMLTQTWKEYFSGESSLRFSKGQCPMLIGIKRQLSMKENSSAKFEIDVLLQDDLLVRTNEQLNSETLLCELIVFKEEFDQNEQFLSSDFVQKIASCPELALEVAEYLSLNDAVATFSMGILPLLWQCNRKLPVIEPSEEFIKAINRTDEYRKIISLRLEASQFREILKCSSSQTFTNVKSLTIINLQVMKQIFEIRVHFPSLSSLSLRHDQSIDLQMICKIFNLIPNSVERLDIQCDSISCSHYRLDHLFTRINEFSAVKSFVLKMNQISRSLVNYCAQGHQKCVLRTIVDFIKIMSNIRNVRIVVNKSSIEALLDAAEWTNLTDMSLELEKISLKGMKNLLAEVQLNQQIEDIQDNLHHIRESINFEVRME